GQLGTRVRTHGLASSANAMPDPEPASLAHRDLSLHRGRHERPRSAVPVGNAQKEYGRDEVARDSRSDGFDPAGAIERDNGREECEGQPYASKLRIIEPAPDPDRRHSRSRIVRDQ